MYLNKNNMRKIIIIASIWAAIISVCLFTSCTDNSRVKNWGGEATLHLPKGQKLLNVTWKGSQLWYLTRPMTDKDVPETYYFHEESSWGMVEGTYVMVESK